MMVATDYYGKYLELHDKTKGACATIGSRPCSAVAGKLSSIVSEVSGLHITDTWRGDLSGSYQNAIESCVNALNSIANSVSSTWASGESTYNQLLDDLNKLEIKDKEYKEKVKNEPKVSDVKYIETYKEPGEEPGKFIFRQYHNMSLFRNDHSRWEEEVNALVKECENLIMAIEIKKSKLLGMSFNSAEFSSYYAGGNGVFSRNLMAVKKDVSKIEETIHKNSFETDGTPSENAAVIWNFFKSKGFNNAQIAGIMSNIARESWWTFSPSEEERASKIGYGLIQWSYGRRTDLENAATKAGVSKDDMQFQLEFLWDEVFTPSSEQKFKHPNGDNYYKLLKNGGFFSIKSDAHEASRLFEQKVERSRDDSKESMRYSKAVDWYNALKGKETVTPEDIAEANQRYDLYY